MYIVHTSFVSLETTFYLRVILQGFVDPIMQHAGGTAAAEESAVVITRHGKAVVCSTLLL